MDYKTSRVGKVLMPVDYAKKESFEKLSALFSNFFPFAFTVSRYPGMKYIWGTSPFFKEHLEDARAFQYPLYHPIYDETGEDIILVGFKEITQKDLKQWHAKEG